MLAATLQIEFSVAQCLKITHKVAMKAKQATLTYQIKIRVLLTYFTHGNLRMVCL